MRIPLPIQSHKTYDIDEIEICKEECYECKWSKIEKDNQGDMWAVCTSPDGYFEQKED